MSASLVLPVLSLLAAAGPGTADAAPSTPAALAAACPQSYERAQEERRAGRLTSARRELQACIRPTCPEFIVNDCRRWLDEVDAGMPSVVFAARQNGRDLEVVSVYLDGRLLTARLDGRSVAVDPGKHAFTFVAAGAPRQTVEAVIAEGQKHRLIAVDLPAGMPRTERAPVAGLAADRREEALPSTPSRAERVATVGMAVLGGVGVAAFAAFGLSGWQRERELRDTCSPLCHPDDERSVRRRYLAADISLGTGLAALAVSGYLYQRSF